MTSEDAGLALRALITRGVPAMALFGLVACATTTTAPVPRQADPCELRSASLKEKYSPPISNRTWCLPWRTGAT